MDIEVVSIASEVLAGATINTNAAFISKKLSEKGFVVSRHTVLPDEAVSLKEGLSEALRRSKVILCTGGLGPTCDDHTREIAAEIFDSKLIYDESLEKKLASQFERDLPTLVDQATVPEKAQLIPNSIGTASGLIFHHQNNVVIFMPGVPSEMKEMFTAHVLPYLIKAHLPVKRRFLTQLYFCKLMESSADALLRKLQAAHPSVEFGIYPSEGLLSISLGMLAESSEQAFEILDPILDEVKKTFIANYYSSTSEKIEEAIQEVLVKNKKTLTFAESCTGGAIGAALTKVTGASTCFPGAVISYSEEAKERLLGVSSKTILEKGVVSEEVAREMAQGVLKLMNTDYSIAVTGFAGPDGGTPEKPVGTVCFAICEKNVEPYSWTYQFKGRRDRIIHRSVNEALSVFWLKKLSAL
jgi:nicotinamide-nucleotide amidase